MTDDTEPTPEKHQPEYYAQGKHLSPEERDRRVRAMQARQAILDEAKQKDRLPPRPRDTDDITFERAEKAATKDETGKVVDPGFEDFVTEDSKLTKRMLDGSVLDALFSKAEKYPINGDQYAAGRQLHSDFDLADIGKIGAVDTTRDVVQGGQFRDIPAKAIDALGRYRRAIKAVGHTHAHILFHVVLMEERLEAYGQKWCHHRNAKLAKVAAKEALRRALTDLAFHYFGRRQVATMAAHAADYKPSIPAAP
jgi:hypothetical protein